MTVAPIHRHRRMIRAACLTAALLIPIAAVATPPSAPTTYQECYKSAHSCQKTRCRTLDGRDQVTCMQQCNREYETCASHATTGSPTGGAAEPAAGKGHRHRHGTTAGEAE